MQQSARQSFLGEMKVTSYTIFGLLFALAGLIALIHPNFAFRSKKDEIVIQNQKVLMETRRVVSIPRPASTAEVALGIGLVFFGSRKPRSR